MANVPAILAEGADWFRSVGTKESPGTIVVTITGPVQHAGVGEVAMGTTLRDAIETIGGGAAPGRRIVAAMSGVSNALVPEAKLDTPLTYEAMAAAGSGLGAAGFLVFDDTTDLVGVAAGVSRFLAVESCGQCRHCKQDGLELADLLGHLTRSDADDTQRTRIDELLAGIAEGARCNLPYQQQAVVGSVLTLFADDVDAHLHHHRDAAEPVPIGPIATLDGAARGSMSTSSPSNPTGPTTASTRASGPPTVSTTTARPNSSDASTQRAARHIVRTGGQPAGGLELAGRLEAEPLVAGVVRRVRRLEVRRHVLGVDALEVVGDEGNAEAAPAMVGMRADEAEVVVRDVVWVVGIEEMHRLGHVLAVRAEELAQHRRHQRLFFRCALRATRLDPDRRRFARLGHPHLTASNRGVDPEAPPHRELRRATFRVGERPAPNRIAIERPRHRGGDRVDVGCTGATAREVHVAWPASQLIVPPWKFVVASKRSGGLSSRPSHTVRCSSAGM